MKALTITLAGPDDAALVTDLLARLAEVLGDAHAFHSTPEIIRNHGQGPGALFGVLIAREGAQPLGLSLFLRHFSTHRGQPGVYVQDLWVADEARGAGLGRALLAATARHGADNWGAAYLALTVNHANHAAQRFYKRLGFDAHPKDCPMSLNGAAFTALAGGGAVA